MPLRPYINPASNVEPIHEKYVGVCSDCLGRYSVRKYMNFSYSLDDFCSICSIGQKFMSVPISELRRVKIDLINGI
jgi:hypothetical protein